jgi:hypothetical protein
VFNSRFVCKGINDLLGLEPVVDVFVDNVTIKQEQHHQLQHQLDPQYKSATHSGTIEIVVRLKNIFIPHILNNWSNTDLKVWFTGENQNSNECVLFNKCYTTGYESSYIDNNFVEYTLTVQYGCFEDITEPCRESISEKLEKLGL